MGISTRHLRKLTDLRSNFLSENSQRSIRSGGGCQRDLVSQCPSFSLFLPDVEGHALQRILSPNDHFPRIFRKLEDERKNYSPHL